MHIPLVIAFTPNYFIPAAVTLHSILGVTAKDKSRFNVYCLVTDVIPDRQKKMLDDMAGDRMIFHYISLRGRLDGLYVDPKYSEAASYRLLLPELLPKLDDVLYVDCDILVRQDIASLFRKTELEDNLLAAVYEAPIENQADRWKAIGCDPHSYFNSGFLIMNLAQMREEGTSSKLLKELDTDYLEFPDQDALNIVCKGRVMALPPVYNGIRTFFLPQYKEEFFKQYSQDAWDRVQKEGTIHYTGGKPWNLFTVKFGEWWDEYRKLPDEIKQEWAPSFKIKALAALYIFGPAKAIIDLARNLRRKCTRT